MVTSTNNNATYHLAELDEMRIVVPMVRKGIKCFKKRHKVEWILKWKTKAPTRTRSRTGAGLTSVLKKTSKN